MQRIRNDLSFFLYVLAFILALFLLRLFILSLISILAYFSLILPEEKWKPLNYVTLTPEVERVEIDVNGRSLAADVYRPTEWFGRDEMHPGILIFTPLLQEATKDPRVMNFGNTFARLGFVVLIPERPASDRTFISIEDRHDARASWYYLRDRATVDDERAAIFGMSYGLGPSFVAAAADPIIREQIPFIAGFGGYGDLSEALRFTLTGHYAYEDIRGHVEPDEWVHAISVENIERALPAAPAKEALLSSDTNDAFDEAYARLPEEVHNAVHSLSPVSVADRMKAPVLLIHSEDDPYVPFTESLRLRDAATQSEKATVSLINIFSHGDYYPLNVETLRDRYIPSLGASLGFLYRFFVYSL